MSRLSMKPVVTGAAIAAAIAIVAALALRLVADASDLVFAVYAVILVGMGVGGYVAGRPQPNLALTAGANASTLGCVCCTSTSARRARSTCATPSALTQSSSRMRCHRLFGAG